MIPIEGVKGSKILRLALEKKFLINGIMKLLDVNFSSSKLFFFVDKEIVYSIIL
jgi:hypothetical protein